MKTKQRALLVSCLLATGLVVAASPSWTEQRQTQNRRLPDAAQDFQTPQDVPKNRPEQQLTSHDRSPAFLPANVEPASTAFANQPQQGKITGFDFYRDPLNAPKPMTTFAEVYNKDVSEKPRVMDQQRALLEKRYVLAPRFSSSVKMSRGKPVPIGPTARLQGASWDDLANMAPDQIRSRNLFPYPPLPHPKQVAGGQVFPQIQIDMFPRLQRFDVDFDLPDAFIPEFPPAIFLQNRPELGDVSRGEVVSINNFERLFKDILTPVQLDGLRMLLTPIPQEEFNATDDRKSAAPSLGVACFDCHVNGHTTAQFHLSPDIRPQERRFRLDTTSLRGMYNQQIHSSKRSLRSVEDFTEFEQRTAYFNGDQIHAFKKGPVILDRIRVSHMAQLQNMLDFPPAPKLDPTGRLIRSISTPAELAGEEVFYGKGRCAQCHMPPIFMDQQMHDLQMERFTKEPGDGPIKTFTLRGIKDSPPYMHDGRCFTLEDTVEFFNIILNLKLTRDEKANLAAFMHAL